MNNVDSSHKSFLPYLALAGVSVALILPAWFHFQAAKVPFFSFSRAIVPLQVSALGLVVASGGLVHARKKRIAFEGSLLYTRATVWKNGDNWYDEIEGHNIILGAIPLNDLGHFEELKEEVCAVLTCLERFEQEKGWFNRPVTGKQWQATGITWQAVEAADFKPMTQEQIQDSVAFLQAETKRGRVYVHCKAGRGRSATAVIAFLMAEKGMSLNAAHELVKAKRSQINLNPNQWRALQRFENSLKS